MDDINEIRMRKIEELKRRYFNANKDEKEKGNVDDKGKIIIYTTPTCPYCAMAKRYLDSKGVKYTEVNVAADIRAAQEMIMKSGEMGVPQIEINGKMIIGFDRYAIDEELRKLGK
ncbi:MAG: glutaredoxin domain-containing protein [Candidatus Anstonellales archaeon]